MSASEAGGERARPPGRSPLRTAGLVFVGIVAVYVCTVGTYRILNATLFPDAVTNEYGCRQGAQALFRAVELAREKTSHLAQPEREALSIFRSEIEPTWSKFHAISKECVKDGDKEALSALRTVELLRYAEERTVRYQAIDLTLLRKRAPRQVRALKAP
jgi:hypothetical protein